LSASAYRRIAGRLLEQIRTGVYAPGAQLPPASALAREYRVSSRTAVEALKLLLDDGVAVSKPGSGTFVAPKLLPVAWPSPTGVEEPYSVSSRTMPASDGVARRLGIGAGAAVTRTQYVYAPGGRPRHLTVSWESLALTGATVVRVPEGGPHAGQGVAARMAAIGHPVTRVLEDIGARLLTPGEASLLGARAGIAVVVVERTRFSGEVAVETADIVLPPPYRARYETFAP
jgi:DNA-binding GntR family transcriptional regulator